MSIREIERMDTLKAKVIKSNMKGGGYLKIQDLCDAEPIVRLTDGIVCEGDMLLISVKMISECRSYITASLDSVISV